MIGLLLQPGFSLLALAGATEVLTAAHDLLGDAALQPLWLSPDGAPVVCGAGMPVPVQGALGTSPDLSGLLVVADSLPPPTEADGADWCRALQAAAARGAVLGGLGLGAAWLAQAGLLRGHRCTLAAPHAAGLAQRHADSIVSNHVYEIDRGRLTCAGGTASLDMLIAWLGLRHGERAAQQLAAQFGLERIRARDDRQRSPVDAPEASASAKLTEAMALMQANLGEPLATEDIARLVGVSRRQLERLFKQHLDALPSRWYLQLRLDRARRLLQQTPQSILQIGLGCGFSSGPHFSNAYRAHFGHTPRDARAQRAAAWRAGAAPNLPPAVPAPVPAPPAPQAATELP